MMTGGEARRKRSGRVALTTMVALTGGALLSACGGDDSAGNDAAQAASQAKGEAVDVYENVFDCAARTGKTREECTAMREDAIAVAEKDAPRFEAIHDCEAEYGAGQCAESKEDEAGGRRHFFPFIAGWISTGKSGAGNAPLFNAPGGGFQTANGMKLAYAGQPGKYYASARALERATTVPKVKPASRLAKAGGFGPKGNGWHVSDRHGGAAAGGAVIAARSSGG